MGCRNDLSSAVLCARRRRVPSLVLGHGAERRGNPDNGQEQDDHHAAGQLHLVDQHHEPPRPSTAPAAIAGIRVRVTPPILLPDQGVKDGSDEPKRAPATEP
jgi:hypothetical protein